MTHFNLNSIISCDQHGHIRTRVCIFQKLIKKLIKKQNKIGIQVIIGNMSSLRQEYSEYKVF